MAFLASSTESAAQGTVPRPHPLDPLTATEVEAATAAVKAAKGLADTARVVYVSLYEPSKAEVCTYEAGTRAIPPPRRRPVRQPADLGPDLDRRQRLRPAGGEPAHPRRPGHDDRGRGDRPGRHPEPGAPGQLLRAGHHRPGERPVLPRRPASRRQ